MVRGGLLLSQEKRMIPGLVSTPIPFVLSSLTKIKDDRGDTSTGLTAKTRKKCNIQYGT